MGYYVKKEVVTPPNKYLPAGLTTHPYVVPDEIHIKNGGAYCNASEVWLKQGGTYCKVWPETRATHTNISTGANPIYHPPVAPGSSVTLTARVGETTITDTSHLPLSITDAVLPAGVTIDSTDPAAPCVKFTGPGQTARLYLGGYVNGTYGAHLGGEIRSDGTASVQATGLSGAWTFSAPLPKLGDAKTTEVAGEKADNFTTGGRWVTLSLDFPKLYGIVPFGSMYFDIRSGTARDVCLRGLSTHVEAPVPAARAAHFPTYGTVVFEAKPATGGTWQRQGTAPVTGTTSAGVATLTTTMPSTPGEYIFRAKYEPDPAHPTPVTWLPSTSDPSPSTTVKSSSGGYHPTSTSGGVTPGSGPTTTTTVIDTITSSGKSVLGTHASSGWKSGDTLVIYGKVSNLGFSGTGKVQIQWSSSGSHGWHNWGSPLTMTFGVFGRTERVTGSSNLQFRAIFTSSDTSKYANSTSASVTARHQAAAATTHHTTPAPKPPAVPAHVSLSYRSHTNSTPQGYHHTRDDANGRRYAYYGRYSGTWGNHTSDIHFSGSPTWSRVTGGTVVVRNAHAFPNAGTNVYIYFGTVRHTVHVPKSGSVTIHLSKSEAQSLARYKVIKLRPTSSTSQSAYGYMDPHFSITLNQH